jgi:hypothetical protein
MDLIDDLELGEKLPRRELFDFLLIQTLEPIKECPLVRKQFCIDARHGNATRRDSLNSIRKHKSTNGCPKNASRRPKDASQTIVQLCINPQTGDQRAPKGKQA